MCVREPASCNVELYMAPVKIRKWLFSFPIPPLHRDGGETEDHKCCFLLHLSFILTHFLFPHFCTLCCFFTSLAFPFALVLSPSFCSFLHSVAFCLFSSVAVSLYIFLLPAQLHVPSLSSAALGLSLIIQHQNIFSSLFPGLCSPHLNHVILKSEGTAFAVFNESLFVEKEKRPGAGKGKAMSHTAEPARWMHFD